MLNSKNGGDLVVGSNIGPEVMEMTLDKMRSYENWPTEKNVHCDEEMAKDIGFSQPICRAMMFSVAVDKMLYSSFGPTVLSSNKINLKYLKALFPGDACVAYGEILSKNVADDGHIYSIKIWIENQHQEVVAMGKAQISA